MERLTAQRCNGIRTGYWTPATKEEVTQRLGAYEDTGLTPEEIRGLSGRGWTVIDGPETLPPVGLPVLVCRPYGRTEMRVESGTREPGGWWRVYGTRVKRVTAWQPMPAALPREAIK